GASRGGRAMTGSGGAGGGGPASALVGGRGPRASLLARAKARARGGRAPSRVTAATAPVSPGGRPRSAGPAAAAGQGGGGGGGAEGIGRLTANGSSAAASSAGVW